MLLVFLTTSLALSACGYFAPVPPPVIRANQAIKNRYEIIVDVGALPAHSVSGQAYFGIENHQECVKSDQSLALGGVTNNFTQTVHLPFQEQSPGKFAAVLIADPFQDANYFGRGICHWYFINAGITLDHGIPTQTMSLSREDLSNDMSQRTHNEYCAAELRYTQEPPWNFCVTNAEVLKRKISHLNKILIYNRRILP